MSVLHCQRKGCSNIMCDRHSPEFGYICDECFEDLIRSPHVDICDFMHSEKTTIFNEWKNEVERIFTYG